MSDSDERDVADMTDSELLAEWDLIEMDVSDDVRREQLVNEIDQRRLLI